MPNQTLRLIVAVFVVVALMSFVQASYGRTARADVKNNQPLSIDKADPLDNIDCAQMIKFGIEKQENLRASEIRIKCGLEAPASTIWSTPPNPSPLKNVLSPSAIGGVDVDVITGTDTYPTVTQSGTMVWGNGDTIFVAFQTSPSALGAGGSRGHGSYSTDGGATFTRLNPNPFATGHGTNLGSPMVVYNQELSKWYAGFISGGCGGQGVGLWESTDAITWTVGACGHTGTFDDRTSMWVDNNSASPYYGRMYISWNDFALGQGIFIAYSDDGTTWSTPVQVTTTFIRNVMLTGSPGTDGTVFLAAMDEGGGAANNRTNHMYRSTNGGVTWTGGAIGASFAPPGSMTCPGNSYWYVVPPIWRHMGWGQPAVGPAGTVHYVYSGAGVSGDIGDIFYTRSTDNGTTWSTPIRLNQDTTTYTQWLPSLVATSTGRVLVTWHDRRNSGGAYDYELWGRISNNGGVSWQNEDVISDVLSPQPLQPDPILNACYCGYSNYLSVNGSKALVTWTDGRVLIDGNPQQDVFFDQVQLCATLPGIPTGTVANATAPNEITVNWNTVTGADCYNVYRYTDSCPGGTTFTLIGNCVTAPPYLDTAVNGGITYAYKVTALTMPDGCQSDFSVCDAATATGTCHLPPTFAGATNVIDEGAASCGLTVNWSAGTTGCPLSPALTYAVYKSTDPGFTPSAATLLADCVSGTSYLDSDVAYGLTFYYIVRAEDSATGGAGSCNGGNIDSNLVRKDGSPTGPPVPGSASWPFETGLDGWTVISGTWALNAARVNPSGSTMSLHSSELLVDACDVILSPFIIPTATSELTIPNWYEIEPFSGGYWYDRLNVHVINQNDGTRTLIAPASGKTYETGTFFDYEDRCSNIGTEEGWAGDTTGNFWGESVFDLSSFAGQRLKIEIKYFADTYASYEGAYIDDVTVTDLMVPTSCQNNSPTCTTPPVFAGLASAENEESSNCSIDLEWSEAEITCPTATGVVYNIYRSLDPDFVPSSANLIATCITGTTFVDLNVYFDRTYYYVVRAEDSTANGYGPCNSGNIDANLVKMSASPTGLPVLGDYLDDMESGTNGWTVNGGLWHMYTPGTCVPPGYHSPNYSWYYGQDASCNYSTGAQTTGELISPVIPGATAATELSFWFYREVEDYSAGGYDISEVDVSGDGGPWNQVWYEDCANPSENAWTDSGNLSLSAFDGQDIQIRFVFDSLDGGFNTYQGWAIDDVSVTNVNTPTSCTTPCNSIFADVTASNPFCVYIEKIRSLGISSGCTTSLYCPTAFTQRQGMAKFVCLSMNVASPGSCDIPDECSGLFQDIPPSNPFCVYAEALYNEGITNGCSTSPLNYCPTGFTQRQGMAKFICISMDIANPGSCPTVACAGTFGDVTASNPFCTYIEGLYNAGVVNGCTASPLNYCPTNNVNRQQMSKFLVLGFAL